MIKDKYIHVYADCTTELYYREEYNADERCPTCMDYSEYLGLFCFSYKEDIKELFEKTHDYFPDYILSKLVEWGVDRKLVLDALEELVLEKMSTVSEYIELLDKQYSTYYRIFNKFDKVKTLKMTNKRC